MTAYVSICNVQNAYHLDYLKSVLYIVSNDWRIGWALIVLGYSHLEQSLVSSSIVGTVWYKDQQLVVCSIPLL